MLSYFQQIVYGLHAGQTKTEYTVIIFDKDAVFTFGVKIVTRCGFKQKQHHTAHGQLFDTVFLAGTAVCQLADLL